MNQNIYDNEALLRKKIAAALERLSVVLHQMLAERAKVYRISALQARTLVFLNSHNSHYRNLSYLAQEFGITKATLCDSLNNMEKRGLIERSPLNSDRRIEVINLSEKGREVAISLENFLQPVESLLTAKSISDLTLFYSFLSDLIYALHRSGYIKVNRMCYSCRHFSGSNDHPYCSLLRKALLPEDIQIDCPDHVFEG